MGDVNIHQAEQKNISLTETAKQHVINYLEKNNATGMLLSIKKTGCSGYGYHIDYVKDEPQDTLVYPIQGSFNLFVEKKSLPFLQGLVIDYVKQGLNQKFVFTNPNQKGQCGCGESFTV